MLLIEPFPDDGDEFRESGRIRCPACGQGWVMFDGEYADLVPNAKCGCPHLRFVWVQGGDGAEFCNGSGEAGLHRAVEPAACGSRPDLDGESWRDHLDSHWFGNALWANVQHPGLTHLFDYTERGVACGPVSQSVLFGASLPAANSDGR